METQGAVELRQSEEVVSRKHDKVKDYIKCAVGHWLLCKLLEAPEKRRGLYVPQSVRVDTHKGCYKAQVVAIGCSVNHEEMGVEIKDGMNIWCDNNIQDAITFKDKDGEYARYIFVAEGDIIAVEG